MVLASGAAAATDRWPQFRGPEPVGVADDAGLPETWSSTRNGFWKTDVPGAGWSSPIAWGDRIFVTSVIRSAEGEQPKKGFYFGGNRPAPPPDEHRRPFRAAA